MEPINPLLPALRPDTPGLLRRAGGMINAVRDIQWEASAEYWYGLAMAHSIDSETRLAYAAKSEGLLRYDIGIICQLLESSRKNNEYTRWRECKYVEGSAYPSFSEELWYNGSKFLIDKLFGCYELLVKLADSSAMKADLWIELAQLFNGSPYRLPQRASESYSKSFSHESRLETLIAERQLSNYYQLSWNWPEKWNSERIMSVDASIEQFPYYPGSYFLRGQKLFRAGNYKFAINDWATYFDLGGPENLAIYELQAHAHFELGNGQGLERALINVHRLGGRLKVEGNKLVDPNDDDLPF